MTCTSEFIFIFFFFSSRRRHTRFDCDWSSDVCSSDLESREVQGVSLTSSLYLEPRTSNFEPPPICHTYGCNDAACVIGCRRSEERRVGKECRSRWSPYH